MLSAGSSGLRFAIEAPAPDPAAGPATSRSRLTIEGYSEHVSPGRPALPQHIVLVAVPPEGAVRVRGIGLDPVTLAGPWLPAAPDAGDPAATSESASAPGAGARARILDVSWMRNQRVARVAITPADFDRATGSVVLSRMIEVEVEFDGAAVSGTPLEDPDPFEGAYRSVLVNYEQGRAWRRTANDAVAPSRGAGSTTDNVLVGRLWVKIAVPTSGMYQVTFNQVRNASPFAVGDTVSLSQLRLFTLPGFPLLSEEAFCDTCDLEEVAISFKDDGNGLFNEPDDAFVFYGMGASDWANAYDPARPDTVFFNHPYESRNYYYLTVSREDDPLPLPGAPRRIPVVDGAVAPSGSEIEPATFLARAHFEVDSPNEFYPHATSIGSSTFWEKWFWRSTNLGGSFTLSGHLPGIDSTQAARLRLRLWGVASSCDECRCPPIGSLAHWADVTWNATLLGRYRWGNRFIREGNVPFTVDWTFTDFRTRNNALTIAVPPYPACPSRTDRVAVAWFDVFYARRFEPVGDVLRFESPALSGDYLYRIGPFAGSVAPRIFDVSDATTPVEIIGASFGPSSGGGSELAFEATQSGFRRYQVLPADSIIKVAAQNLSEPLFSSTEEDLRTAPAAEYVIIYFDGFKLAADSLAAWRRSLGLEVEEVPISALYDQFSGGRTDPSAIRSFLRAAYQNWSLRPSYVTLLGDASYDYKNYKARAPAGLPGTLLPTFENLFDDSPSVNRQYATDDWMLNALDRPGELGIVADFFGSRLPAADAVSAMAMVQKVLRYERSAPFGEYRNRVMFIADDNEQGALDDGLLWTHLDQTARLDSFNTPIHADRAYVYLHKYPDGAGETKPEAKNEIIAHLNGDGVAIFNYVGHGSPFQISDERVFLDTDVGTLTNADRLPLFVAASCDVGKFDDPTETSLGERLIVRASGGAIGVISATELAFSGQNSTLNQAVFRNIFERDAGGRFHVTMSEALLRAKFTGSENSQKYQLLGDSYSRLNLPDHWIETAIYDSAGRDTVSPLVQGRTYLIRGRMLDGQGGLPLGTFSGVASVLVEDPRPVETPPDCELSPGCFQPTYFYRAAPIFRGELGISGGSFQGRFVAPFECRLGDSARVRVYASGKAGASGASTDAVGSRFIALAAGTATGGDLEGPKISLSFAGGSLVVRGDAVLRIGLSDPSGILITGYSRQNGVIVTMDDNSTSRIDVSSSFRYAADSYQQGTASFQLPGLAPGPHRIRVSAADNLASGLTAVQHRSSATVDFEVRENPALRIANAYLFPNPTRSGGSGGGGQFVIDAPGDSVNALLRIYTVSGRLVRELKSSGGIGQVQIPWDGLDAEREKLANGLYLFKVHVNAREEEGESSARLKVSAEGRIVIVGR